MMTVSAGLVLIKNIKTRIKSLEGLRETVSKKESWYSSDNNKVVEPQYDVKKVDEKIVGLQKALFKLDNLIKAHNARSMLDIQESEEKEMESILFDSIK